MLNGSNQASLPKGILITTCVTGLSAWDPDCVPVELINHSAQRVTAPWQACLCEVCIVTQINSLNNALKMQEVNTSNFLEHFQHLDANLSQTKWKRVSKNCLIGFMSSTPGFGAYRQGSAQNSPKR